MYEGTQNQVSTTTFLNDLCHFLKLYNQFFIIYMFFVIFI